MGTEAEMREREIAHFKTESAQESAQQFREVRNEMSWHFQSF